MLTDNEVEIIQDKGAQFILGWNTHGKALFSELHVAFGYFIILAVDEKVSKASGCSIDKSMQFIRDIEKIFNIQLTNRLTIALLNDTVVNLIELKKLQENLRAEIINPDQLFFDHTVQTIGEIKNNWIKPLKNSWLSRYLPEKSIIS